MSERLRKTGAALSLTLVTGLGLTACATSDSGETIRVNTVDHDTSGPRISYVYHSNGTREILVNEDGFKKPGASVNNIFEFCDGVDLVELSENNVPEDWNGSGITRTVSDPACADGKLTPSDFQSPAQ